jgi:hypothetical protein
LPGRLEPVTLLEGCGRSGDRRLRCTVGQQFDAWQPVQADKLDQVHDLGLRALQQQPPLTAPQAIRQHREVQHQCRIRENQIPEVDEDIALSPKCENKSSSPEALGASILVSGTDEHRRVIGKLDDPEPYKIDRW